jgi:hypothetical protein
MQTKRNTKETGNVLICVLGAILLVSVIGATVLRNSTTRLNVASNQVRAWKESLSAAETGGDIAFAEIRKQYSTDPLIRASQWTGWTPSPTGHGYISPPTTFGRSNLMAQTVVETGYFNDAGNFVLGANPGGNSWYRLRSKGTAPLPNLKRTGMDDALIKDGLQHFAPIGSTAMQDITARGNGDSLLRKIDFQYDHFVATYGPLGDGAGKALVPAPLAPLPSISRRIEQIVSPMTPFFDAAIKANGIFYGLGSAAYIDSYDSRNGQYDRTVKDNPSSPYFADSRHGSVQINNSTATVMGTIYGDVATNGGNVTGKTQSITGTIDNNVPFTLNDYLLPSTLPLPQPPGNGPGQLPSFVTGNQPLTPLVAGGRSTPVYYQIASLSGALTVYPFSPVPPPGSPPVPQETWVAIRVTGDISGGNAAITINPKVHLKIYFEGNISMKNNNIVNQNPSFANPYAGNLQFYGISPARDANGNPVKTQTIDLNSGTPQTLAATFYAPSANVNENGNPDFIGTMVCKSFNSNGNISWHYDRALNDEGESLDSRIASYVEDTR